MFEPSSPFDYKIKTYPLRTLLKVLAVVAVLIGLSAFFLDQNLSLYFKRPELTSLWLFARNITNVGLSEHYFVISILLYVFCRWGAPRIESLRVQTLWTQKLRTWARDFFLALIVSGIAVHIVKNLVGRQRPHVSPDCNPFVFHPLSFHWDYQSFASGHSQVLFTVATMLALAWPRGRWGFFILAGALSFTRVIVHDHFLSDVLGGAYIGFFSTITTVYWTQLPRKTMPVIETK